MEKQMGPQEPIITFVGVPKAFDGHIDIIQRNAISSWCRLRPAVDIVIFGDEPGVAQAARDLGVRHIPRIERNDQGTPLVSAIFEQAEECASTPLIAYLNADIMVTSDFLPAVRLVAARWDRFLLAGRRHDVDLTTSLDFSDSTWEHDLRDLVADEGILRPAFAIDYFVFPRGLWDHIPPFALGRPGYDNWLIFKARSLKVPVIDGMNQITAIHQNHDYAHLSGEMATFLEGPETRENMRLAGGIDHIFNLDDATWLLTKSGLKRAAGLGYWRQRAFRLSVLSPVIYLLFVAPFVPFYRLLKNRVFGREAHD